jgi:transcription antitermination factor NusG
MFGVNASPTPSDESCGVALTGITLKYKHLIIMTLSVYHSAVETGEAAPQPHSENNVDVSPRWYAAYTLPRHEKAVADRLTRQEVETYLPLYRAVHYWNHRRAGVELPLFPGYLFVKMIITDRVRVLAQPGVIRLVTFNGKAAALPDNEVEQLRSSLGVCKAEPYPFLAAGKRVRIKSGPLAGLEGKILRRKGMMRLVVSIDLIQRAILLELDAADAQLTN